jgi:hypothetical protein
MQAGIFEEEAQLSLDRGAQEAALLRYQGKVAKTQSYFKALSTVGTAGYSAYKIGGPPTTGMTRTGYTSGIVGGGGRMVGGV